MPPWFYLCLECSDGVGRYKYLAIAAFITIYTLHGFVSVIRRDRVISALGHSTTAFICAFLVNLFCLFSYWWFIYRFFVLIFIICFAIFACFESLFASGFGAVGVADVVVFVLIIVCFLAVEVSLLVLGFDEEDAGVAETFVAPVADLIYTASVWQPTDTTCFATTLANDDCLLTPSTIFRASGMEIFRSVRTRWISFSVIHRGQFLE